MASFDQYSTKYKSIHMERRNGILQMTFHTDDGPLNWGGVPHTEFSQVFVDVGSDPENRIIIMTGTGDIFSGPPGDCDRRSKTHTQRRGPDLLGR
ncbi:MAG: hypothetical protein CM1200mP22_14710 [Dehalococcoidia bacterium]|nr:MAG: hypothetical protein CM1200mP22_14710 [Dehalococcoidia bacterium]